MKPLNFREPVAWLIIVAMGFFIAYQCSNAKVQNLERLEGNRLTQQRIEELNQTAQTAAARINELEAERIRTRDSAIAAQSALKIEIKGYQKTIARLRPGIQPKIDSFPDLREFVALQDSVIVAQDTLINRMNLAHSAEVVNLESQLKESGRLVMIEAAKGELWRKSAETSQKQVRKLQRGKVFRNIVIGVLTAGVVVISIRE